MGADQSIPANFEKQTFIVQSDSTSPFLVDVARIHGFIDQDAFCPIDDQFSRFVVWAEPRSIKDLYAKLQREGVITPGPGLVGTCPQLPYVNYSSLMARTTPPPKQQDADDTNQVIVIVPSEEQIL